MSRVGKYPVIVPEGVNVTITENMVKASGKLGELSHSYDAEHVSVELKDGNQTGPHFVGNDPCQHQHHC